MLKSMTGFGKAECLMPTKKLTIEIKSLNSKQIDTSTRLPAIYKEKELEIRQIVSQTLIRGKIEVTFHYEQIDGTGAVINKEVVKNYLDQIMEITENYNISPGELLSTVMRLPDTVTSERAKLEDNEWETVKNSIHDALKELNEFRTQEGEALKKDISECISAIREKLKQIAPFESERIEKIKERIKSNLNELNLEEGIDENKFEQELLYYIEKLDINEEKVRLLNHLDYFTEILNDEISSGKKLGFISQEIGREINTLGSKANHADIQRLVMEMKDELEKIKEQILNVL